MADVPKTIGGTTPDYATWSLFVAAIPADISSATGTGDRWIGKSRDVSITDSIVITTITDSTNRVVLTYDTGAQHDGRARDVSGTGAEIRSDSSAVPIKIECDHITIDGLDIARGTAAIRAIQSSIASYGVGSEHKIINCIIHTTSADNAGYIIDGYGSAANVTLIMQNNVWYGGANGLDTRGVSSAEIDNDTGWNHTNRFGITSTAEATIRNTVICKVSGARACFNTSTSLGSNNASFDTSGSHFSSSLTNLVGTDEFTNVTASTEDFSLLATSNLIDNGVTIAGLTTDIIGVARPDGLAYDIGAFEYLSAPPVTSKLLLLIQQG